MAMPIRLTPRVRHFVSSLRIAFRSSPKGVGNCHTGFTLIEILIVIGIFAILAGLGLFLGFDVYTSNALRSERNTLLSVLEKTRSRAMNNMNESGHGLYITSSEYIMYRGSSYASRNPSYDENIQANPAIAHTGLQEVSFGQLTGNPSATGTITLSDAVRSLNISVEDEGMINW